MRYRLIAALWLFFSRLHCVAAARDAARAAQPMPAAETDARQEPKRGDVLERTPPFAEQLRELEHALSRLPIAAGLACVLALRPRRRGTPQRQAPVIQTQIILAVVGAVVMLVVGSSLARAFGIVGAAGLVRYRAKIEDPKDAGVMLSTLAVGLASGVGLWLLAVFATVFILARAVGDRIVRAEGDAAVHAEGEGEGSGGAQAEARALLARYRLEFELRGDVEGGAALRGAHADRRARPIGCRSRFSKLDPRRTRRGGVGGEEGEEVEVKLERFYR